MDTKREITVVFKVSQEEYRKASPFIGDGKYRHYWAKNAFFEKVSRMEANDQKARNSRMVTDARYINELIRAGLITGIGNKG
jgi:hypothetical protein